MSRKMGLIMAVSFVMIGLLLFTVALGTNHWDFRKFSTVQYEIRTYQIEEAFQNLQIQADTTDVQLVKSDEKYCRVVCYESEMVGYTVGVEENTLHIQSWDDRKWYDHIGIYTETSEVTVYLPDAVYENMDIRVSTGDVELTDVRCQNFTSVGSTGDLVLKDVIASEKLEMERNTGDIFLTRCDAAEIRILTGTGDVKGSFLSGKNFTTETDTGDIHVPQSVNGGICEIQTHTGDITITVE